jgi:hypothetical protein
MRQSSQTETQPHGNRGIDSSQAIRGIDQFAVGHSTRTRRFTSSTLDAGVERFDDFLVESELVLVQSAHDLDTPPRRLAFIASDSKSRTMRKAQATSDAAGQSMIAHVESRHTSTVVVDTSIVGADLHFDNGRFPTLCWL